MSSSSEPVASADEQPNPAKKAKLTPPPLLEDAKYSEVTVLLKWLQKQWNDDFSREGRKRSVYLQDMDRVSRYVSIFDDYDDYYEGPRNDFECFISGFKELTKAEQMAFQKVAKLCVNENRRLLDEDLNELLLSVKPEEPYFISLDPDTSESNANGTERFPFASIIQAERALVNRNSDKYVEVKLLHCAPSCNKKHCFCCPKMVCTTHGMGSGTMFSEGTLWEFSKCIECKETIGCYKHMFPECSVCRNVTDGEMALGMHGFPDQYHLYRKCAKFCKRVIMDRSCNEEKIGTVCGFRCCPKHYNNHKCGDVPSDYV